MRAPKKYVNSKGVEVDLSSLESYLINDDGTDIRDYEWESLTNSNFRRSKRNFSVSIAITAKNQKEARNSLCAIFDEDVVSGTPGRLYVGEYYLSVFVTASTKKLIKQSVLVLGLTVTPVYPAWIKEVTHSFYPLKDDPIESNFLTYPHTYPYTYSPNVKSLTLDVHGAGFCDHIWAVYGPATNPAIFVNGVRYQVNVTLQAHELLIVDSKALTCKVRGRYGQETNVFHLRSGNVFNKIPSGRQSLYWDRTFAFDITLLNERSEPEW